MKIWRALRSFLREAGSCLQSMADNGEWAPCEVNYDEGFDCWWEGHGQYLRSGGREYHRTFALHAWREATRRQYRQPCVGPR